MVLAGLAVVGYLVARIGPGLLWKSFSALGWRLPVVLGFPYALAAVVDTLAWRVLLPGWRVSFALLLRARLAGEAVNLATPTASVGGEPLKAYLLRPGVPLVEGLASVIGDKTTVVAAQVLFLAAGLLAAGSMLPRSSPLLWTMAGLLVVEFLAVGGFVLVQTRGVLGGGGRLLGRVGARIGVASARYQDGLGELDRALAGLYRHRRRHLVGSTVIHAVAWASGGLEIYVVLSLLGASPSLATALVIESFAGAVKFASFMVPASLGALEGGYVAFFEAFGLGGAAGLSYVLVRRLREAAWTAVGFLALGAGGRRPAREEADRARS